MSESVYTQKATCPVCKEEYDMEVIHESEAHQSVRMGVYVKIYYSVLVCPKCGVCVCLKA